MDHHEAILARCLTGAGSTEANAYLVRLGRFELLLDAGASRPEASRWLDDLRGAPDAVFISHVHADHIGALAALCERYPSTRVLMTPPSAALLPAALRHLGGERVDALTAHLLSRLTLLEWETPVALPTGDERLAIRLTAHRAGHMLGAACLSLEARSGEKFRHVVYLPDFCFHDQPLTPGAALPQGFGEGRLDLLIMEGVLGADRRADRFLPERERERLVEGVWRHREQGAGGAQLLALPALGLSCEVAAALSDPAASPQRARVLIVHDFLEPIFKAYALQAPSGSARLDWAERGVRFATQPQCAELLGAGHVVLAPGRQAHPATPAHHLLKRLYAEERARVLFFNVDPRRHSVAARLLDAERGEPVPIRGFGASLGARIERVIWPTHASRRALVRAARALKPEHIWLVHGQHDALASLKKALGSRLDAEILAPASGDSITL